MIESWLSRLGPIDLIAATLDIALGLLAAAWFVVIVVRSAHGRGQGPSE